MTWKFDNSCSAFHVLLIKCGKIGVIGKSFILFRYDVEVDHSRRSALKKITERDDTPAKTIVLCVCGIAKREHSPVRSEEAANPARPKPESPAAVVWLTDGWYSIKALLDAPLSAMLRKGRLRVGVKLLIHGAELIGSQDACPPLEAPDSLMLKVRQHFLSE